MKPTLYIPVLSVVFAVFLFGQPASAQEWQVEGSAFFADKPSSKSDEYVPHFYGGLKAGIGYNYYLSEQWSVGLGLSYLGEQFDYKKNDFSGSYLTEDAEQDPFEFRYKARAYSESEKWKTLQIPLTVQYETKGDIRWYARTGLLYGLVLGKSTAHINWKNLQTSGYYEQWNAELTGPKFIGFGDLGDRKSNEQSIKFRNSCRWLLETGMKAKMGKHNVYVGAFFEWGFNNIRPDMEGDDEPIQYLGSGEEALAFPSVWTQSSFKGKKLNNNVFGVKLRYGFGKY